MTGIRVCQLLHMPTGREKMRILMKIGISLPLVALLAIWASDSTVAQIKPETGSATILRLEAKWNAAYDRGDIATMNSLLADDFIITVEDGGTFSKSGYIAHYGDTTVHVETSEMSDLKVRMHGKTAVVTGGYHEKGTSKGKPYEYRDRFTDVWMNINGTWEVIAPHYSIPSSQ
jgi:ketosteroid isomerase-like protein